MELRAKEIAGSAKPSLAEAVLVPENQWTISANSSLCPCYNHTCDLHCCLLLLAIFSYLGVLFDSHSHRRKIFDLPNERSSHIKPIPLGGGMVNCAHGLAAGALVAKDIDWKRSLIYIISASIMAWVGWHDDVNSLSAVFRFIVQSIIALVSIFGMGYFKLVAIPMLGHVQLGLLAS